MAKPIDSIVLHLTALVTDKQGQIMLIAALQYIRYFVWNSYSGVLTV